MSGQDEKEEKRSKREPKNRLSFFLLTHIFAALTAHNFDSTAYPGYFYDIQGLTAMDKIMHRHMDNKKI